MEKPIIQVHIPYPVLLERLDDVLEKKINPEIYLDGDWIQGALPATLKRLSVAFEERGLRITLHGPYADINPGSFREEVRLKTIERYKSAFESAAILKAKNIVLHAGYSERAFKGDMGRWLEQSLKTWPEFASLAESQGITIAAENIFDKNPLALLSLVKAVGSPAFMVCIDAGHLNICADVPFEDWFQTLGGYIAEVHLHDNNGKNDDHMVPGTGSVDFPRIFSLIRQCPNEPVYTIEPHMAEDILPGIEAVQGFLRDKG